MRKRILCCIVIVVILAASIMPAFGIGAGGSDATVYAGLQFETITNYGGRYDGSVAAWPFNDYSGSPAWVGSEYGESDDLYFSASVFGDDTSIRGTFAPYDATWFSLNARYLYFDGASSLYIAGDDITVTSFPRVIVEYDVVYIQPNAIGSHYQTAYDHIYYDSLEDIYSDLSSNGRLNIRDVILRAHYVAKEKTLLEDYDIMLLEDVSIKVYFDQADLDAGFTVEAKASAAYPNYVGRWLGSQTVAITTESGFNMAGWIVNSLGAFLEFEFIPGFSLNAIFAIIFVIAIVLVLIKLFS